MLLPVEAFPVFRKAGFPDDIYIGVIANTLHFETVVSYLQYLLEAV